MMVDAHAHVVMPEAAYRFMGGLVGSRANPIEDPKLPPDEVIRAGLEKHIANMNKVKTDLQFISPRPYIQMHSLRPAKVTETWTRYVNDLIHRQCQMFPDRLRGVAGLPQHRDASPVNCLPELTRTVKELGFVGCLLNPDPVEATDRRRRAWATSSGIRSTRSSASWTCRRSFIRRAPAIRASPTR